MLKLVVIGLVALCAAYEKDGDVIVLHDSDIEDAIKEFPFILVEFYAPWCGHCKRLTPEYAAAATALAQSDNPIPLAKVDATVDTASAGTYGVRGYPTIKFFVNGQATDYTGGRTSKDIIGWIKKKTGPALRILDSVEAFESFKNSADVVTVVFAAADSHERQVAEKDAQSYEGVEFGLVSDEAIASAIGYQFPSAVLFKKFDEGTAVFDGVFAEKQLSSFVDTNSIPLVSTFSQSTSSKIFGGAVKTLFLYFNDAQASGHEQIVSNIRSVAADYKGKAVFVFVPASEQRVLKYFGFEADDLPKATLVNMLEGGTMKKFAFTEELTEEGVRQHISAYFSGALKPTFKSEEPPADNSGPVKVVVGKNFADIVLDTSKDAFVEFYAPWCGHCKSLAPTWDKLGEAVADYNVVIAKVDATANDIDHPGVNVRSYPTLLWFPANNKAGPELYSGGRELQDLVNFVKDRSTPSAPKHEHQEL